MADIREIFPIIENTSTNAGEALGRRQEGEAGAAINGLIGFSFKDSSGDVILPSLNVDGALPVTLDAGTTLRANGELVAGSTSLVDITSATITLTLGKKYTKISAVVSSRRDTLFQIVHVDDDGGTPTETVLLEAVVGSGQFSFKMALDLDLLDTAGGAGIQILKIKGQNFNVSSSMRAGLSTNEVP